MGSRRDTGYWARRIKGMEGALLEQAFGHVEGMERQFAAAQAEVEREIAAWYQRFADANGITFADAKRQLTAGELAEFRWSVGEYIAHGQQNALDGAWLKQLENASARAHVTRLEALKLQIQQQAERLYAKQLDAAAAAARETYLGSYYGTAFEVQRGLGVGWTMGALNESAVTRALSRPWTADGQTFRDRCWTNKRDLVNSVNTQLTQMIIRGEAPEGAIDAIAKQFNVSRGKAGRLIMTESAYFASAAQKDSFAELGVERYKIVAAFDRNTCAVCGGMDGKVFKMSEYQAGLTAPPFHPWCRCCTAPYFEDMEKLGERWARSPEGSTEKIPEDMGFEEWRSQFVVQESDLGDAVRRAGKSVLSGGKVVGFDGLPKDFQQVFRDGLTNAAPETRKILERMYRKTDYMLVSSKRSYYRQLGDVVGLGRHAVPSTLAHELFHKIDAGGKISLGLSEALMKDYIALNVASGGDVKAYLLRLYPEVFEIRGLAGQKVLRNEYRGISDILNGLSDGEIRYGYGHSPAYWKRQGALEAEAWAQFGAVQYENNSEALKIFSTLFSNFNESATLTLKGLI